jgi:hypothetical protein
MSGAKETEKELVRFSRVKVFLSWRLTESGSFGYE